MNKEKLFLGKWKGTHQISNNFWVKKFAEGIKIRKKGQGEITLFHYETGFLAGTIKDYHEPRLYNQSYLEVIYMKFPKTREFIESIIDRKLSWDEVTKIKREYERNQKVKQDIIRGLK